MIHCVIIVGVNHNNYSILLLFLNYRYEEEDRDIAEILAKKGENGILVLPAIQTGFTE